MKKIFVVIIIFLFSFSLRLWNLNQMGRTWDESAYVEVGYKFIKLIEKGDFKNKFFYEWADEPPLARYIYGIASVFDEKEINNKGEVIFDYDYTYPRVASAIISSLSVVLVVLIGIEFISISVGIIAGIILSLLPLFVGYSQLTTLESILFFTFTASVYSFLRFLRSSTYLNALATGVFVGLAVLSKFTNALLIPIFISIFVIWRLYSIKIEKKILQKTLLILLTSIITFFGFWPMFMLDFNRVVVSNYILRSSLGRYPSVEIFFGRLMHVPVLYYFVFFLITTPFLILIFFLLGSKYISDYGTNFKMLKTIEKKRNLKWIFYSLILWFCIVFIQSFYNFRQHGVRYILEIYAPFALISAIGFDYLVSKISKKILLKFVFFIPVIIYMFVVLIRITPYYLDYFNILVGGTKNVYEKRLFQLGWWGQGIREAGLYLENNAPSGSRIGLAVDPVESMPKSKKLMLSNYSDSKVYDYVVVGYYRITRLGLDDSIIKNNYNLIYSVKADGASLVWVYKFK